MLSTRANGCSAKGTAKVAKSGPIVQITMASGRMTRAAVGESSFMLMVTSTRASGLTTRPTEREPTFTSTGRATKGMYGTNNI